MIKKPKYSLIESVQNGCHAECDECGRELMNYHLVKNNETNETLTLGSGCVLKYCEKSVAKIKKENTDYEKEAEAVEMAEKRERQRAVFVSKFAEVEPEVLKYIEENADSIQFLYDMKLKIEEQGTIPAQALKAIRVMMIPFKQMEAKTVVEGKFEVLSYIVDVEQSRFANSINVQMWVRDDNNEKFKVITTYSKTNENFVDDVMGLVDDFARENNYDFHGREYYQCKIYPDFGTNYVNVKGKYDGWKVKRAKISFA